MGTQSFQITPLTHILWLHKLWWKDYGKGATQPRITASNVGWKIQAKGNIVRCYPSKEELWTHQGMGYLLLAECSQVSTHSA